jgi:CBS domain containing-hemolysin-like protein
VPSLSEDDQVVGILTLENVIEKLLMTEIADEKDREQLRAGLNNRTNSAMTRNDGISAISVED